MTLGAGISTGGVAPATQTPPVGIPCSMRCACRRIFSGLRASNAAGDVWPSACAAGAGCTSQQRNTHSTDSRVVRYRWHPWFGQEVWVHQARQCQWHAETVVRCGLTPDLDARSVEVPLWMFDGAVCDVMVLSEAPTSSAAALRELKILLLATRNANAGRSRQSEHLELFAPGDAHVDDSQAVLSGVAIDVVPTSSASADMGDDAHRESHSGRTAAGAHVVRVRRTPIRLHASRGGTR